MWNWAWALAVFAAAREPFEWRCVLLLLASAAIVIVGIYRERRPAPAAEERK